MDVRTAMKACGDGSRLTEYRKANPSAGLVVKRSLGILSESLVESKVVPNPEYLSKCSSCSWKISSDEPGLHEAGHSSTSKHLIFTRELR